MRRDCPYFISISFKLHVVREELYLRCILNSNGVRTLHWGTQGLRWAFGEEVLLYFVKTLANFR